MISPKDEINKLSAKQLTPLGRRILARHALITRDGDTGVTALARLLGVTPVTVWRVLKDKEPGWMETARYMDLTARLCELLRCDHSWLFDTVYYGDLGELHFDLRRRNNS